MIPEDLPMVLFTKDVCEILRYKHADSVLRLVKAGKLRPIAKSKPYRFSRMAVLELLQ